MIEIKSVNLLCFSCKRKTKVMNERALEGGYDYEEKKSACLLACSKYDGGDVYRMQFSEERQEKEKRNVCKRRISGD